MSLTLEQGFDHLIESEAFKNLAKNKDKEGGRLRKQLSQYRRGELSEEVMVKVLQEFGYEVDVIKKYKVKLPKRKRNENL